MANEMDIEHILENEMINALEDLGDNYSAQEVVVNTPIEIKNDIIETIAKEEKTLNIDNSNIQDITNMLKELLNDNSLEITIKLKKN